MLVVHHQTASASPSEPQNKGVFPTPARNTIGFDSSYFRTLPGILKVVQIFFNALGLICIQAGGPTMYYSRGTWFNFVAWTGFCLSLNLLIDYLFHIVERFNTIPWLKIELIYDLLWSALYLIAASMCLAVHLEAFIAAGVFGFFAMLTYGTDAFFKYKAIQSGRPAQGDGTPQEGGTFCFFCI